MSLYYHSQIILNENIVGADYFPWFCSDTQSRWSDISGVRTRHTRHDAWRWNRRRDRRATDFLLCDFLLARFQALSMKPRFVSFRKQLSAPLAEKLALVGYRSKQRSLDRRRFYRRRLQRDDRSYVISRRWQNVRILSISITFYFLDYRYK